MKTLKEFIEEEISLLEKAGSTGIHQLEIFVDENSCITSNERYCAKISLVINLKNAGKYRLEEYYV